MVLSDFIRGWIEEFCSNEGRLTMRLISVVLAFGLLLTIQPIYAETEKYVTYENPLVYVGADGDLYMMSLTDTTRTLLFTKDEGDISGINWSPDGTQFVF